MFPRRQQTAPTARNVSAAPKTRGGREGFSSGIGDALALKNHLWTRKSEGWGRGQEAASALLRAPPTPVRRQEGKSGEAPPGHKGGPLAQCAAPVVRRAPITLWMFSSGTWGGGGAFEWKSLSCWSRDPASKREQSVFGALMRELTRAWSNLKVLM